MWPWPWRINKAVLSSFDDGGYWEFRRFRSYNDGLARCLAVLGLLIIAGGLIIMTDEFTTWKLPVWDMEPEAAAMTMVFLCIWYGVPLAMIWRFFRQFQTVRISREEVRFCMGSVVFRRIPLGEICTVVQSNVRTAGWDYRYGVPPSRMIFSRIPVDELRERSRGLQLTRKMKHQELRLGDPVRVRDETVKSYLGSTWLENRDYMEWNAEAALILRKLHPTATFIQ